MTLDDWAQEVIESNGLARWRTYVHFFSVDAVKAGYLLKTKGIWQITSSGVQALSLGELGYFLAAREGYRAWKRQQLNSPDIAAPQGSDADDASVAQEPPEDQFERLRKEVNSVLAAELSGGVHALALHTYTPDEWLLRREAPRTAPCVGKP